MTVSYHCDNVTQEFEEGQLQIVKTWIEKRDSQIKDLDANHLDMKKSFDELKSEYEDMKKKCDELKAEMDKAKGKCDTLEAELSTRSDSEEIVKLVKHRRILEREVTERLDSITDEQLNDLTDRQLKETLIKANYDFNDLETRTDEAIDGMYAIAVKYHDAKRFEQKKSIQPTRIDETKDDNFDMISELQDKANQSRNLLFGVNK
jgi:predicted  nucleic acid-binding Zn-ribbon protein